MSPGGEAVLHSTERGTVEQGIGSFWPISEFQVLGIGIRTVSCLDPGLT